MRNPHEHTQQDASDQDMSMAKTDGGPAFPQAQIAGENVPVDLAEMGGMSLRDYFAAKAMQAIVYEAGSDCHEDVVAKRAYFIADAMLAERSKS